MAAIVRTLIIGLVLAGVAGVFYWQYTQHLQLRTEAELRELREEMAAEIAAREAMIERLSRSRRLGRVDVTDQTRADDGEVIDTTVRLIELDEKGAELARQTFTVPGDVVFIDALTVKFDREAVALGHPLMAETIVLLQRVYSDRLPPREGRPIDMPGAVPAGYAGTEIGQFEQRLWSQFWTLATDSRAAARLGVRVAQGEAVYKPMRTGESYDLEVDAAGGVNLTPRDREADPARHAQESADDPHAR